MSGKGNFMNQYREWISNERMKVINGQNKVILPRLANEEAMQHKLKNSIKKKDEEINIRIIKDINSMDSSRVRNYPEGKNETARQMESEFMMTKEEKCEIIKEIKGWIKTIDTASKDEGKLQDSIIPKLQSALYKWAFFIQQMFNCYQKLENSPCTPLRTSIIRTKIFSEDGPQKLPDLTEGQMKSQKEFYEKEMKKLSAKIKELEEKEEKTKANNFESIGKIEELEKLFGNCVSKIREGNQRYTDSCQTICCILIENESFLVELKQAIAAGKEVSTFQERIDFQLVNLREYKTKFCEQ